MGVLKKLLSKKPRDKRAERREERERFARLAEGLKNKNRDGELVELWITRK